MKTININKVIREIEKVIKVKTGNDDADNFINFGLNMAKGILLNNIKEDSRENYEQIDRYWKYKNNEKTN